MALQVEHDKLLTAAAIPVAIVASHVLLLLLKADCKLHA
jgi:NO-binding membrane sensor protein with MHYT domain